MNHPTAYKIKVVPDNHADWSGDTRERVYRGIVEEVGTGILEEPEDHERWSAALRPGGSIYYTGGIKIGDAVFVETTDLIAYQED